MCVYHTECIEKWQQRKNLPIDQCCVQRCRVANAAAETVDIPDVPPDTNQDPSSQADLQVAEASAVANEEELLMLASQALQAASEAVS